VLAPPVLVLIITVATSFIVGSYQAALVQASSASNTASFNTLQTVIEVVEIVGLLIGVVGGVTAMVLCPFDRAPHRLSGHQRPTPGRIRAAAADATAADEIGDLGEQLGETSTLLTQRSTDLVRAHTAALEAAAEADELLARISHELRTPLTAVMGFGQLIDRSQLNDADADAIEQILRAGERMLRIIEEGRRPAHTSQAVPLDLRAVAVGPLVQEVQSLMSPLSAGRGLTVISKEATGTVMADSDRFKQVLINLNVERGKVQPRRRGYRRDL
jgi:signal transduction histidine kinase